MQVNQSITVCQQDLSNVLINKLIANFFRFCEGTETILKFGIVGQVIKLNLRHKLLEVLVLLE